MNLRFKTVGHGAGLETPSYGSAGAAGFDLRAAIPEGEKVVLSPGERRLIPAGVAVAVEAGFELQVRPRSGLAFKNGVTVLNSPGTIDSDYRGEIGVILINHGDKNFEIARGDRIAQAVIARHEHVQLTLVDELDETERGAGGFGSTGQK